MLEFKVSAFYQATYELNDLATWVEARKHDPDSPYHPNKRLGESYVRIVKTKLATIREHLDVLGTRVTALAVCDALNNLDPEIHWYEVVEQAKGINVIFGENYP